MSLSIHCATSGGGHFGIRCIVWREYILKFEHYFYSCDSACALNNSGKLCDVSLDL